MSEKESSLLEQLLTTVNKIEKNVSEINTYIKQQRQEPTQKVNNTASNADIESKLNYIIEKIVKFTKEEELPQITFTDFVEGYYCNWYKKRLNGEDKLKKLRRSILNRIQKYFGDMYLQDITIQDIHDWIIDIENNSEKEIQPTSIHRYCSTLKAILNHAIKFKFLSKNVVSDYNFKVQDNINERTLKEHEIDILLSDAEQSKNKDLYLALQLALNTGLRNGEIHKARKSDIIQHKNCTYIKVRAKNAKSNKERAIPLNNNLYQMLLQHIKNLNDNDLIFSTTLITAFRNCVERIKTRYGVPHFRFHDIRHTFASRLIERGATISDVQTLLGHSTVRLTERYMHNNIQNLVKAVNLLNTEQSLAS